MGTLIDSNKHAQHTDTLLLATCRADPTSVDEHSHIPLAAGDYRLLLIDRAVSHPLADTVKSCACHTCENTLPFSTCQTIKRPGQAGAHDSLPTGDIIIVVHGFNCTEDAGVMAAYNIRDTLMAWGLPLSPATESVHPTAPRVLGFTWPCEHTLLPGYMLDKEAVARFAAFSLANLLSDLRRAQPSRRLHIVAHSMGCFLTLKALNMLAVLHDCADMLPVVDDVVWLAPDINADALERSTPSSPRLRAWQHPGHVRPFSKIARVLRRPKPEPTALSHADVTSATRKLDNAFADMHPLDGYGYAALDAIKHLSVYCSLRDEAMWASPWANHATEESGSAAGSIRLGWCGPLHPQLALIPDTNTTTRQHPHQLTLVDCTAVIFEHGDYFFNPITQRAITAQLATAQRQPRRQSSRAAAEGREAPLTITATQPPERQQLTAWHQGAPLQFPPDGQPLPCELELFALVPAAAATPDSTVLRPGAPVPNSTPGYITFLWHSPLAAVANMLIHCWRWYYHV